MAAAPRDGGRAPATGGAPDAAAVGLPRTFRLGDWWVDPAAGQIYRSGLRRHLSPQQMALLTHLAASGGRLVSKEELFTAVWRGAAVEEVALPRCVSELRKALGDRASAPRYIETIPKRGYRLLTPVQAASAEGLARAARPRRPRIGLAAFALVGLGFAGLLLWHRSDPAAPSGFQALDEGSGDALGRPAVAILGLADRTGDAQLAWLQRALPGLLTSELAAAEGVRVIPVEVVASLLAELTLADGELAEPEDLQRLGLALGADLLVAGSFGTSPGPDGEQIWLDLSARTPGGAAPAVTLAEERPVGRIRDLVALAAVRLATEWRGAGGGGTRERGRRRPDREGTSEPLYYEGLRLLRRFEAQAAREVLERSLVDEPGQPLALAALSEAWSALGHGERAAELARRAYERSGTLPREQRLWLEAQSLTLARRWEAAAEVYRTLWQGSPATLEYGLHLARAQVQAPRPAEAEQTVADIRRRGGPGYEDPRLDLVEARAARASSDHRRCLAAARRAIRLASPRGAELVAAHGRSLEGLALHALGRSEEAQAAQSTAALAFAAAGDRRNEAWGYVRLAGWIQGAGDFERAGAIYGAALASFRSCGDLAGEAEVQLRRAALAAEIGDLAQAELLAEEAIRISQELSSTMEWDR